MNGDLPRNGFHLYQLGDYQLDTNECTLLRDGKMVSITPKMYGVLLMLVENGGRIVSKDELLKSVWSDSIVEEGNLAVTIRQLRRVLGDDAHAPTYIQTIARRGYRLIADVTDLPPRSHAIPAPSNIHSKPPLVLIGIAIMLGLSVLALAFGWFRFERTKVAGQDVLRITNSGKVTIATVSPNGEEVVYAIKDGEGESLWKRDLATGSEMPLVPAGPVEYIGLTVSPSADFAYYSVFTENAVASRFARVALSGGAPELLPEIESDVSVSFSPDGQRFAYTESHSSVKETHLRIANADGTEPRTLLIAKGEKRVLPVFRTNAVAWSPDGQIACALQEADERGVDYRILLIDPEDGSEKYLSEQRWDFIESIAWKDRDHLAITNLQPNSLGREIWLVSPSTGQAERWVTTTKEYEWLSVARGQLFAVEKIVASSICIADFPDGLASAQTKQVFSGDGYIENVEWSDDSIFYNSWASGQNEIWRITPEGTEPTQLTIDSKLTLGFTVSPVDGSLVFTATQKAADALFIADRDGRNIRQLTSGTFDAHPEFSPDGTEVIFQHGSLVLPTIWKVSLDNTPAKQLSGYDAREPSISPDGKMIAYQFMDLVSGVRAWKLGVMDSSDGTLLNKLDFPVLITNRNVAWRPGDNLLTVSFSSGATSGFLFMSPAGDLRQTLANLTTERISSFDWSPDGKRLAFSSSDVTSDVVMLENR